MFLITEKVFNFIQYIPMHGSVFKMFLVKFGIGLKFKQNVTQKVKP